MAISTFVFDLGGVLVDWDPAYLYQKLIPEKSERDHFLQEVCTPQWNLRADEGEKFSDIVRELSQKFPEKEELIRAFDERWLEMFNGEIPEMVNFLEKVKGNYRILALTNWSACKWPVALVEFPFFKWFEGVVVSGTEKVGKPHPDIYQILIDRYALEPSQCIYIDDRAENIEVGKKFGFQSIQFKEYQGLVTELESLEISLAN